MSRQPLVPTPTPYARLEDERVVLVPELAGRPRALQHGRQHALQVGLERGLACLQSWGSGRSDGLMQTPVLAQTAGAVSSSVAFTLARGVCTFPYLQQALR